MYQKSLNKSLKKSLNKYYKWVLDLQSCFMQQWKLTFPLQKSRISCSVTAHPVWSLRLHPTSSPSLSLYTPYTCQRTCICTVHQYLSLHESSYPYQPPHHEIMCGDGLLTSNGEILPSCSASTCAISVDYPVTALQKQHGNHVLPLESEESLAKQSYVMKAE